MAAFKIPIPGADPKETGPLIHSLADLLLANKAWMSALKPNVSFFPVLFMHFTRCLADYHHSVGGNERYRTSLVAVCDFALRERFADLLILGRDFLLAMMRLAKMQAFQWCW